MARGQGREVGERDRHVRKKRQVSVDGTAYELMGSVKDVTVEQRSLLCVVVAQRRARPAVASALEELCWWDNLWVVPRCRGPQRRVVGFEKSPPFVESSFVGLAPRRVAQVPFAEVGSGVSLL